MCHRLVVAAQARLIASVKRSDENYSRVRISLDKAVAEHVHSAVEGPVRPVGRSAKRSVTVTEIVRAAENDDNVRVRIHLAYSRAVVIVVKIRYRAVELSRDSRTADAVIAADRAGLRRYEIRESLVLAARSAAMCNAVAEEIYLFP